MPTPPVRQKLEDPKTVSIILDAPDRKVVDSLAEENRCSRAEVVRMLIRRYGVRLVKS